MSGNALAQWTRTAEEVPDSPTYSNFIQIPRGGRVIVLTPSGPGYTAETLINYALGDRIKAHSLHDLVIGEDIRETVNKAVNAAEETG